MAARLGCTFVGGTYERSVPWVPRSVMFPPGFLEYPLSHGFTNPLPSFRKSHGQSRDIGHACMPCPLHERHAHFSHSLSNLLAAVEYNPRKDTIFMSGDLLAKSTEAGSLAILDFIVRQKQGLCAKGAADASRLTGSSPSASQRKTKTPPCRPIYAVRGNHDQMVIQWRAWRDWFEELQIPFTPAHLPRRLSLPSSLSTLASSLPFVPSTASYDAGPAVGTGSEFLALIEAEWLRDRKKDPNGAGSDVEEWIEVARKRAQGTWRAEWWRRIPRRGKGRAKKEWIMFGDHYNIAR